MTTAQAEGTEENNSPPGASASQPQGAPPSPKVSVGEGGRCLLPTDGEGAAGAPASASAQPWGASRPQKLHAQPERDASSLSAWTRSYSSRTQQTEHVHLKTANQP